MSTQDLVYPFSPLTNTSRVFTIAFFHIKTGANKKEVPPVKAVLHQRLFVLVGTIMQLT